ncbi:unnamed protein product, partial [Rotaria sp. Silwood1]
MADDNPTTESHEPTIDFYGGGQAKENDILRQACSLLATKDTEALDTLNKYFDNTDSHDLYRKLMNNVTILNAVSFPMNEHEEVEAMGMDEDDQNNIVNPSDIKLYYDCVSDLGFSSIDFGKLIDGICIGFSTFSIRSNNNNNFIWYTYNKNIEKMKIKYANEPTVLEMLDKSLSSIPTQPLFDVTTALSNIDWSSIENKHYGDDHVDKKDDNKKQE